MTRNQIEYQNLQQTKLRDERAHQINQQNVEINRLGLEETKRHNTTVEMETNRHNLVVEQQAYQDLGIKMYNAESGRIQAHASSAQAQAALMNAKTNAVRMEHDYEIGLRDIAVKEGSLEVSKQKESHEYEVAQGNLEVNKANAKSSAIRAKASERQALTDLLQYYLNKSKVSSDIDLNEARIVYERAQADYAHNKAMHEWIDTVFGGWDHLMEMLGLKTVRDMAGSIAKFIQ